MRAAADARVMSSPTYQSNAPEGIAIGSLPAAQGFGSDSIVAGPGAAGAADGAAVAPTKEFPIQKIWPTAVVVMIHFTVFTAVSIAFQALIKDLFDNDNSKASIAISLFTSIPQVLQFLLNPFFGVLSDLGFGRRVFMLMSSVSFAAVLWLVAISPTLTSVVIAAVVRGCLDTLFAIAAACITDVSPTAEVYAKNFGVVGATIAVAIIVGYGLGAALTLHDNKSLPFWAGGGLAISNILFLTFCFKDTRAARPAHERTKVSWSHANPFNNFHLLASTRRLLYFTIAAWLIDVTSSVTIVFFVFTAEQYDWDQTQNAVFAVFFGIFGVVAQGAILPYARKRLSLEKLLYSALGVQIFMFCCFSVAFEGWVLYLTVLVCVYGLTVLPVLRGELSKEIPKASQGALQAALSSALLIATIAGNFAMSGTFSYFISSSSPIYAPTAPFILAALFAVIAMVFMHLGLRTPPQYAPDTDSGAAPSSDAPSAADVAPVTGAQQTIGNNAASAVGGGSPDSGSVPVSVIVAPPVTGVAVAAGERSPLVQPPGLKSQSS